MKIASHPTNNIVFKAPPNWDAPANGPCEDLPATKAGGWLVSFWKPSPEELADLQAGKLIALWIGADVHPVVAIQVEAN